VGHLRNISQHTDKNYPKLKVVIKGYLCVLYYRNYSLEESVIVIPKLGLVQDS
jgi:hypothetical protein